MCRREPSSSSSPRTLRGHATFGLVVHLRLARISVQAITNARSLFLFYLCASHLFNFLKQHCWFDTLTPSPVRAAVVNCKLLASNNVSAGYELDNVRFELLWVNWLMRKHVGHVRVVAVVIK